MEEGEEEVDKEEEVYKEEEEEEEVYKEEEEAITGTQQKGGTGYFIVVQSIHAKCVIHQFILNFSHKR